MGETARKLAHRFREHFRDVEEDDWETVPKQLRAISTSRTILLTTWQSSVFLYIKETRKTVNTSNKNLSLNEYQAHCY